MSTILASLITFFGTLISTIGLYYLKRWHDQRHQDEHLGESARDRQAALSGSWTGTFTRTFTDKESQSLDDKEVTIPIKAHLTLRGKKYTGTVEYIGQSIKLSVIGWFLDNSTFRLDYRDQDLSVIRHGCTILQLSPHAKSVEGYYVGYNPDVKMIVTGFIHLNKII